MSLETILAALDRHAALFDLSGELGDQLLNVARDGVASTFDAQADPDGVGWEPLSSEYARIKAHLFPGRPMGVATGEMAEGLDGERSLAASEARWTFGRTETQRAKAVWFQSPPSSRPARPFVGLTDDSTARSREVLDAYFMENL